MRIALLSLLICATAAALEGVAAGRGAKRRFRELQLPSFSPSLGVWGAIGLFYYVTCWLLLQRLLGSEPGRPYQQPALLLLLGVMAANASWNYLFFRLRNLRASFLAFVPYSILVLTLSAMLLAMDPIGAAILLPYLLYLGYASWWIWRLWQLNDPR